LSSISRTIFTSFAAALIYALDIKRYSQRELANLLSMNESQVSRWTNGTVVPYPKTQAKVENALHVKFEKEEKGWYIIDQEKTINSGVNTPPNKNKPNDLESLKERISAFDDEVTRLLKRFRRYTNSAHDQDMLRDALEKIEDLLIHARHTHLK